MNIDVLEAAVAYILRIVGTYPPDNVTSLVIRTKVVLIMLAYSLFNHLMQLVAQESFHG
jgi:hypothetical protein